jgi:hypothetical protein
MNTMGFLPPGLGGDKHPKEQIATSWAAGEVCATEKAKGRTR